MSPLEKFAARIKAEPLALRAFVAAALNLCVVGGVLDPGQSAEANTIILAGFNLLLFKGARDRVSPVAASGSTPGA